ncbi:MAG: restriction endonuclease PLD domain-containing protein [Pseudomonadota bacterium]
MDLITPNLTGLKIASAYVTTGGCDLLFDAIKNIIGQDQFNQIPKVLITSLDYGLTEPRALHYWHGLPNSEVFISGEKALANNSLLPAKAFHPKLYAFNKDNRNYNALVGSANLTSRGLSINTEAAWKQHDISGKEIDLAFSLIRYETTLLTNEILTAYSWLRQKQPPPPGIKEEIQPVKSPADISSTTLKEFRLEIESGAIDPASFKAMWIQGEGLQGGSRNQLELPRGGHKFFGYHYSDYNYPHKATIGKPILKSGLKVWSDRLLTWHGNNKMERLNLPTETQNGFNYANTAVMFRRLEDGAFELIVAPWNSDLANSWKEGSAQRNTIYRLGRIATNRVVGLL